MLRKRKLHLIPIVAAIVLCLVLICLCVTVIPSGCTGVRVTMGQINPDVLSSGTTMTIPFVQKIIKVNNKQQDVTYSDQVWGESNERTAVYMQNITVGYRILPECSAWLVSNVSDYKDNALPGSIIRSGLKGAMSTLSSSEVTNRAKIEPVCCDLIQKGIDAKYNGNRVIEIVNVSIADMDFEESYQQAIANKQIAQLEYEKRKIENATDLENANAEAEKKRIAAQADADQKVIAAKAEADALATVAEAQAGANRKLSESVTDTLTEYEKIQKWDGKLPSVTGANAIVSVEP